MRDWHPISSASGAFTFLSPPVPACPPLLSPQAARFSSLSQGPSPLENTAPNREDVFPVVLTRSLRNSQSRARLGALVSYRCSDR